MTETEKKLYDYAVSVDWDFDKTVDYFGNGYDFDMKEYCSLKGFYSAGKIEHFFKKYKPKEPVMITLPIEDYNRLRKLEIKQEIKKLKKELKGLL